MLKDDVREHIIRPALKITDLWSESAEILVYGTGMVESEYNHLVQIGQPKDGGLGFFQMQPSTYLDLYSYLRRPKNARMFNSIIASCYFTSFPMDPAVLVSNIKFAALMCRVHYYRVPEALPEATDAQGMSEYHKVYYNSMLGDADPKKNATVFQRIINEAI